MSTFLEDSITGDQVVIAPERFERPNALVSLRHPPASSGSDDCPFCPGNEAMTPPEIMRAGDEDKGWRVRVVPNKYAAVGATGELRGNHEVIIETPRHAASFAAMSHGEWLQIVEVYVDRCRALEADPSIRSLALFKNDGVHSGQSIDHPHSQLIALDRIPARLARERAAFEAGACPVCHLKADPYPIISADGFIAVAPEASILPYQVRLAPWRHQGSITEMSDEERTSFVRCLRDVMRALALKFEGVSFNWFFHQTASDHFHWFLDIFPRLTTLGGFELGSGVFINPIDPSSVAETLAGITAEWRGRT